MSLFSQIKELKDSIFKNKGQDDEKEENDELEEEARPAIVQMQHIDTDDESGIIWDRSNRYNTRGNGNSLSSTSRTFITPDTNPFALTDSESQSETRPWIRRRKVIGTKPMDHTQTQEQTFESKRTNGSESALKTIPVPTDQVQAVEIVDNDREQELEQVLQTVQDIKDISLDMAELLTLQDHQFDTLESNIDNTEQTMKEADKEINKAIKYKKDGRNNVIGVTTGAIAGSFFGPIGAASGAAIGLVGTSVYNFLR